MMIEEIVEQIRQLTPAERRRLLRRLQINGLLEPERQLTDRNALQIAPAVQQKTPAASAPPSKTSSSPPTQPQASHADRSAPESYRSAVSGRVVVGTPSSPAEEPALTMRPLPGQAPEQPIRLFFDGGSKGNPGHGYGSYALDWPGHPRQVVRLQFGNHVTNNEAEYDTLIAAVEAVLKRLAENHADPQTATMEIWGDSQLVINQINGEWQVNKPDLRVRRDRARALLEQFGMVRLRYHGRENNVEILGH